MYKYTSIYFFFIIELSTKIFDRLLIIIPMIPNVNLRVGEMGFMLVIHTFLLNNPSSGG